MKTANEIHGHGAHRGKVVAVDHLNKRITIEVLDDDVVPVLGEWLMIVYGEATEVDEEAA